MCKVYRCEVHCDEKVKSDSIMPVLEEWSLDLDDVYSSLEKGFAVCFRGHVVLPKGITPGAAHETLKRLLPEEVRVYTKWKHLVYREWDEKLSDI